jgi:hypothetical protein
MGSGRVRALAWIGQVDGRGALRVEEEAAESAHSFAERQRAGRLLTAGCSEIGIAG